MHQPRTGFGNPAMPVIKRFQQPGEMGHRRADNKHMKDLMGASHDVEFPRPQSLRDPRGIDPSPQDVQETLEKKPPETDQSRHLFDAVHLQSMDHREHG